MDVTARGGCVLPLVGWFNLCTLRATRAAGPGASICASLLCTQLAAGLVQVRVRPDPSHLQPRPRTGAGSSNVKPGCWGEDATMRCKAGAISSQPLPASHCLTHPLGGGSGWLLNHICTPAAHCCTLLPAPRFHANWVTRHALLRQGGNGCRQG